jgi:hypothetical protein
MKLFRSPWRNRLTVSVGLAAASLLLSAAPAVAATGDNTAYAVQTTGLVKVGPLAPSAFVAGPQSNSVASLNLAGLLTTGVLTSSTTSTSSTAQTANLNVILSGLNALSANAVTATCTFNPSNDTVSGTTSIVSGVVAILGSDINILPNPGPNTVLLNVPGIATITLNRQVTHSDGSLTVDGIVIHLLGKTQDVVVSSATCQKATVVGTPIMAEGFAIGGGVLVLLGVAVFFGRRYVIAARRQA